MSRFIQLFLIHVLLLPFFVSGQEIEPIIDSLLETKKQVTKSELSLLESELKKLDKCELKIKLSVISALYFSKLGNYDEAKQKIVNAKKELSKCDKGKELASLVFYADAFNYSLIGAKPTVDSIAKIGIQYHLQNGGSSSTYIRLLLVRSNAISDYEARLEFAKKALDVCRSEKIYHFEQKALMAVAYCYAQRPDYPKAKEYYQKALPLVKQRNSNLDLSIIYNNLAFFSTDSSETMAYLDSAYICSQKGNDLEGVQYATENKSYYLFDIGAYRRAYTELTKAMELKDSLFSIKKIEAVADIEEKYQTEKKTNEIQRLKLDSINRAELERLKEASILEQRNIAQRRNRIQYSAVIILVIIIAVVIASSGKMKIKPRIAEGLIFFFFILLFEFALVVTDPWVDRISQGQVGYKIAINTVIALLLFATHQRFEKGLKRVILNKKKDGPKIEKGDS